MEQPTRVIPKNTQINKVIWKGFTLLDFGVFGFCLVFVGLIAFSNLPANTRIFTCMFMIIPFGVLFFPNGEGGKMYQSIISSLQFMVATKKFAGNAVKAFVPYTKIDEDGLITYPEYYSKVVSVGQIEFKLLDLYSQCMRISEFENVLKLVDEGSCLDIVKIDRPLTLDIYQAQIFKKMEQTTDPIKRHILKGRLNEIDEINNLEKQYCPFFYLVFYSDNKKHLYEIAQRAVEALKKCEIGGQELNDKETVNFLKYCNTRFFDEREIDNIAPDQYIDYIVPKKLEFTRRGYKVDDVNAFTFAINDYPLTVGNAWGADIFNIENTKVVLKVRPVDNDKAVKRLDKLVNELNSREDDIRKMSDVISKESHIETTTNTLVALQNNNECLFDCTLTVTAFNNDNEDQAVFKKSLKHDIQSIGGFRVSMLSGKQIKAFLASNISAIRTLKSMERGINSSSLSAVFPFCATRLMDEPNGIILGYNRFPVALDITKRGGDYTNSNCLILGKPGGGKSFFAKSFLLNLYAEDWRAYVLDVENEFAKVCKEVNGSTIDIGSATTGRLNPFHIYSLLTDDGKTALPENIFNSHLMGLESFFKITLEGLTTDTLEEMNNLVVQTYKAKGITAQTDCSNYKPEQFPVFDDLMTLIKKKLNDPKERENLKNLDNLQRAEIYIAKFAKGGRYSSLWNGPTTLQTNQQFTVFNFQSLLASKNQVVANAQMLLVMRFLEQEIINTRDKNRTSQKITRSAIIAEEAHAFIDPKFPIALDFLHQMAKRIRKYAGALFFITQNLGDGMSNQEVSTKTQAIFANCQYTFAFNLPPQDIKKFVELYEKSGGINEAEEHEITTNPQGRCFLISSTRHRASFKVDPTPEVVSLFIREDEKQL